MPEADRHVEALLTGFHLLGAFRSDEALRLKDLHERTGLNRSRILRLAGTLQAAGFLEQITETGEYRLGYKLYYFGQMLNARFSQVPSLVRPSLRRLTQLTGDTAFYSIVQGDERLVVAREESTAGLRFIVEEGQRRPLHAGATSKVLLAFGPPTLRKRVLFSGKLARLTPSTSVDPDQLERELEQVARDGCSISRGEATAHGFAVAVPVADAGRKLVAALTVAGPLAKLTDDLAAQYLRYLRDEAKAVELALARSQDPRSELPTVAAE